MDLNEYIEKNTSPEADYLKQITRRTYQKTINPRMVSGQVEGRFLSMISRMILPKRILEIGTFTAYSTLCLAEGLQPDGWVDTIEVNDELETMILSNLTLSPLGERVRLHIGDAKEIIPQLNETYDLIFMDADKREYAEYYELCLPLLAENGFMVVDNTLWDGHVVDAAYDKDKQTVALRAFNDKVARDIRVEQVMLSIRDGITIIRKNIFK